MPLQKLNDRGFGHCSSLSLSLSMSISHASPVRNSDSIGSEFGVYGAFSVGSFLGAFVCWAQVLKEVDT